VTDEAPSAAAVAARAPRTIEAGEEVFGLLALLRARRLEDVDRRDVVLVRARGRSSIGSAERVGDRACARAG
jgi:hypothetical protein